MKKEEFIKLLEDYDEFHQNCRKYVEMGIDFYESKYPTWEITETFFDIIINKEYNIFGVDWIQWFVYENDFGRNKYEAFDGARKLICQNVYDLHSYIKQYKK